jgi:beta-galactosidase
VIEIRDRRILIDGKPTLVFAGEIHYFRLRERDWEDRIQKAKDLGCNAIATYIPWVVHEQREGQIDVREVAEFIDLCHRHRLWFIPRPGPFVMAEMKNEGIPHWVYAKHPDAIPVSWNDEKAITPTLDFLHEGFLKDVERWYAAVMPLVADRLQAKGGPVIGVQLDNEIGMLQWVTNQPDLSDDTLCDFARFVIERHGNGRYPFELNDPATRAKHLRQPTPEIGPRLLRDYGDYERHRFARYIATLRGYAEGYGVKGVPFIVNIHGSGGGRGTQFPIGIHQLYESFAQAEGYLSGSDHYLGELTRENAQDLYYINAFISAVSRPEQPITSMEFEVGSGDYGETGAVRMSGAAADFKVRMSLMQGNRLLNYYLLSGGRNPMLQDPPNDGNGRIAVTGERHGFAAPIDPEGDLDSTYFALQKSTREMLAVADKLADMDEEHDEIALAFVPDYYKTDLHRPGPMREIVQNLELIRGNLESLTRAMLFLGFRFPAIDIQNRPIDKKALVLASSRHLDEAQQRKLVEYMRAGGNLLLFGELPRLDMEGKPCTVLAEAMGVRHKNDLRASGKFHLSFKADFHPEVRSWRAETYEAKDGERLLQEVSTGDPVGVAVPVGKGRAVVLSVNYPLHATFYRALFRRLGASPGLTHDHEGLGVLIQSARNRAGERMLSLINLDHEDKPIKVSENGKLLLELVLPAREARLLPL